MSSSSMCLMLAGHCTKDASTRNAPPKSPNGTGNAFRTPVSFPPSPKIFPDRPQRRNGGSSYILLTFFGRSSKSPAAVAESSAVRYVSCKHAISVGLPENLSQYYFTSHPANPIKSSNSSPGRTERLSSLKRPPFPLPRQYTLATG